MPRYCVSGHRNRWSQGMDVYRFAHAVMLHHAPGAAEFDIGMALGWDMACAQACADQGIPFNAVIPFEEQPSLWPASPRRRYERLLTKAKEVVIVSRIRHVAAFNDRNRVMVDRCPDGVWALWDGSVSGTGHCVRYALDQGRPVWNYWDSFYLFANHPSGGPM